MFQVQNSQVQDRSASAFHTNARDFGVRKTHRACWTCCTSMDCKLNAGTFTSAATLGDHPGTIRSAKGRMGTEFADTPAGRPPAPLGRPGHNSGHGTWRPWSDENWMIKNG